MISSYLLGDNFSFNFVFKRPFSAHGRCLTQLNLFAFHDTSAVKVTPILLMSHFGMQRNFSSLWHKTFPGRRISFHVGSVSHFPKTESEAQSWKWSSWKVPQQKFVVRAKRGREVCPLTSLTVCLFSYIIRKLKFRKLVTEQVYSVNTLASYSVATQFESYARTWNTPLFLSRVICNSATPY
jgi:hypothetical protein